MVVGNKLNFLWMALLLSWITSVSSCFLDDKRVIYKIASFLIPEGGCCLLTLTLPSPHLSLLHASHWTFEDLKQNSSFIVCTCFLKVCSRFHFAVYELRTKHTKQNPRFLMPFPGGTVPSRVRMGCVPSPGHAQQAARLGVAVTMARWWICCHSYSHVVADQKEQLVTIRRTYFSSYPILEAKSSHF